MLFDKKLGEMKCSFGDFEEDIVLDEDAEVLNETNVAYSQKYNYSLAVSYDTHRPNGEAYFKFCIGNTYDNSEFVDRISFFEPKYFIHGKGTGKYFKLNRKQKEILIEMLNSKHKKYGTVWRALICIHNERTNNNPHVPEDLEIPDYMSTEWESSKK